jgi:predicted ester cyclase
MTAFPDAHFTIDDAFTDGQNTEVQNTEVQNEVTRWTVVGTHEGELAGIPRTGRRFSVTGISIARIANGKITESWNSWDALGLMQQLGVVSEAKGRAA